MQNELNQRFNFIETVVCWEGQINTTHVMKKFKLSRQAASTILKEYRETFPEKISYNASTKAFVATDSFNQQFQKNEFTNYLAAINPNSSFVFEVEAPLRNINPLQVRPILRAIREKLAIDIGYISLSSPDYLDRIIQPHALVFDGLRWHVRAYCNKNQQFRDFTLSRFNGLAEFEGKATQTAEQDDKWNKLIEVVITPDPRLTKKQQQIIATDFQMVQKQKVIKTRAALVNYLLLRLRLDTYKNTPEEQQIVLTTECRKRIAQYLPSAYTTPV